MRISRRRVLAAGAGAVASAVTLRWPGDAAQFSFKLGNDQPPTHPMTAASIEAAKRISAAQNGQLEVSVFPASALGDDTRMLTQARSGATELIQMGANIMGTVLPVASIESIPFAFQSYPEFARATGGAFGAYVARAAEKVGLHQLPAVFYGGTFQIENALRPIVVPADLKGLKLRVPPGVIDVATFKAFDAAPTVINISEAYTALQTHLVDGLEVPLVTVRNFKFYELVKYISITNHSYLNYLTYVNPDAWNRLPKNLQDLLAGELEAAAKSGSESMATLEKSVEQTLTANGAVFNRVATEPFRKVLRDAKLYEKWRDSYDPQGWALLEKAVGKLT
jgi:tripartite ATP-independent transporter DctP family solute receptor